MMYKKLEKTTENPTPKKLLIQDKQQAQNPSWKIAKKAI